LAEKTVLTFHAHRAPASRTDSGGGSPELLSPNNSSTDSVAAIAIAIAKGEGSCQNAAQTFA